MHNFSAIQSTMYKSVGPRLVVRGRSAMTPQVGGVPDRLASNVRGYGKLV
jgi:hypothetical protein